MVGKAVAIIVRSIDAIILGINSENMSFHLYCLARFFSLMHSEECFGPRSLSGICRWSELEDFSLTTPSLVTPFVAVTPLLAAS